MYPLISVSIVTWNSLDVIEHCISNLRRQVFVELEIIIVDNGSTDGTLEYLRSQDDIKLIEIGYNSGFSFAHNKAISISTGDFILILNPDVFLEPNFLSEMAKAIQLDPRVGQVSGKLLRISSPVEFNQSNIIDTTGLYFTPNQRHFDRGAGQIDKNQFNQIEYIFGASGAAPLFRREALEDTAILSEYFDEDFFAYREDADLSWRMQLLGWKTLYTPYAIGYHIRSVRRISKRQEIPKEINMHSVKNRFLLRIKNQTLKHGIKFIIPTLIRDTLVFGGILILEQTSLLGIWKLILTFPKSLKKRRLIMSRKTVKNDYIQQWFSYKPLAIPYNQKHLDKSNNALGDRK